jgi:hypothetical protein
MAAKPQKSQRKGPETSPFGSFLGKVREFLATNPRHSFLKAVEVSGFKSLRENCRLEIRPLTLLAGANSSGKSSALQPLLLLKQTLESVFDPGPLLLNGSHVRFTSAEQVLSRSGRATAEEVQITLEAWVGSRLTEHFRPTSEGGFELARMDLDSGLGLGVVSLKEGLAGKELERVFGELAERQIAVRRDRCFLQVYLDPETDGSPILRPGGGFARILRSIIHLPGLRGIPERSYPVSAVSQAPVGPFEAYAASIIALWQREEDPRVEKLGKALSDLGLTWGVRARQIDATQIELLVPRLPKAKKGAPDDLVNIADVGFGVSQVLPVLVALLFAEPQQIVFIEQPELHLHPRAQKELASLLMDAANRGVRVVVETHSSILLIALQTLIAEKKLDPEKVILHWFQRKPDGSTKVDSVQPDEQGAYGDWPVDFLDVEAEAQNQYLDAVEEQVFGNEDGRS